MLPKAAIGYMKITFWLGIFTVILFSVPAGAPARAKERLAGPVAAELVRVIDGDTLVVRAHIWLGQRLETRVRLDGLDTPELRGKCDRERELARAARDWVAARLTETGANLTLTDIAYGKYAGRVLATVRLGDGANLAQALIKAGYARPYQGGRRGGWCG